MKTIKLFGISLLLLFISCKEQKNSNKHNNQNTINDSITNETNKYIEVKNSILDEKKFYILQNKKNKDFILYRYPNDFDMRKYVFTKNKFIDSDNIMEPSEWNVLKMEKNKSYYRYIVNMIGNDKLIDTLYFEYNSRNGILTHLIKKGYKPIVLVDSIFIDKVKIIEKDN